MPNIQNYGTENFERSNLIVVHQVSRFKNSKHLTCLQGNNFLEIRTFRAITQKLKGIRSRLIWIHFRWTFQLDKTSRLYLYFWTFNLNKNWVMKWNISSICRKKSTFFFFEKTDFTKCVIQHGFHVWLLAPFLTNDFYEAGWEIFPSRRRVLWPPKKGDE